MALNHAVFAFLFFAFAVYAVKPSSSELLKAKVSCLDCTNNYNFSGIKVEVKCEYRTSLATTRSEGTFEVKLPDGTNPSNCEAKILGGPKQLYAKKSNMVSKVVRTQDDSYTISTPLIFSTTCPNTTGGKCGKDIGSTKTIDLPLPKEWGLAPSSLYFPFFPIIGIP